MSSTGFRPEDLINLMSPLKGTSIDFEDILHKLKVDPSNISTHYIVVDYTSPLIVHEYNENYTLIQFAVDV